MILAKPVPHRAIIEKCCRVKLMGKKAICVFYLALPFGSGAAEWVDPPPALNVKNLLLFACCLLLSIFY